MDWTSTQRRELRDRGAVQRKQWLIRSPDHRSKLSFSVRRQRGPRTSLGPANGVDGGQAPHSRLTRANVEYEGSSLAKALGVSSASVYRALQEPAAQMPLGDLSLQQRGSHVPPVMDHCPACRPSG